MPILLSRYFSQHPRLLYLWRLLALLTLILVLFPSFSPIQNEGPVLDKVNHVLAFFVLSVQLHGSLPDRNFGWLPVLMLTVLGIMIETVQMFIPFRFSSFADVIANETGIVAYIGLAACWRRFLE